MPRQPLRSVVWDTGFVTVPRRGWLPNPAVTYPDVCRTSSEYKAFRHPWKPAPRLPMVGKGRCMSFWQFWLPSPTMRARRCMPQPLPGGTPSLRHTGLDREPPRPRATRVQACRGIDPGDVIRVCQLRIACGPAPGQKPCTTPMTHKVGITPWRPGLQPCGCLRAVGDCPNSGVPVA
jgi:hypothetical protein